MNQKVQIAIFASGGGSNAAKIMDFFQGEKTADVAVVITNNPAAGVIAKAEQKAVPVIVIEKHKYLDGEGLLRLLATYNVTFIALAGWLKLIPNELIVHYQNRIVNIHPSLLPKFGGKGMYGMHVHQAVSESGDSESGMTIHYVTSEYDQGTIIFQGRVKVGPQDSPEQIAAKVLKLEHEHYPKEINKLVKELTD